MASAAEPRQTWLIALAFWCALLLSITLYAAVVLSPKLFSFVQLKHQHYENQVRLVTLEWQVADLQKVHHALEHEPEFAAELARIDFDAVRPGADRISVGPELSLDGQRRGARPVLSQQRFAWSVPLLEPLAHDANLRTRMLALAAAGLLIAFTFLQETPSGRPSDTRLKMRADLKRFAKRYQKPSDERYTRHGHRLREGEAPAESPDR